MKFTRIELKIPEEVKELLMEISKIVPNSKISGGYLCDLYLGKKPKDLDIFIKDVSESKKKKVSAIFEEKGFVKEKEYSDLGYTEDFDVYGFVKDGSPVQIIYTKEGANAVKYFDVRFREFIYFNGQTYASEEALRDIKNKKLVIGATRCPMRTLYRLFKFKEKYGFEIEDESWEVFKLFVKKMNIGRDFWERYIHTNTLGKTIQEKMLIFVNNNLDSEKKVTPNSKFENDYGSLMESIISSGVKIKRDVYERLWLKRNVLNSTFVLEFKNNPYQVEKERMKEDILKDFRKNRVRMIFDFNKNTLKEWENKVQTIVNDEDMVDEQTGDCFESMRFNAISENEEISWLLGGSYKTDYLDFFIGVLLKKYIKVILLERRFVRKSLVEYSGKLMQVFNQKLDYNKFLKGEYLFGKSEVYGGFVYDLNQKKIKFMEKDDPYIKEEISKQLNSNVSNLIKKELFLT